MGLGQRPPPTHTHTHPTQALPAVRRLPIVEVRDGLLQALRRHDVVVVTGDTGSGKTTQVGGGPRAGALLQNLLPLAVTFDPNCPREMWLQPTPSG